MKKLLTISLILLTLVACGGKVITPQQVIDAFKASGLEAEDTYAMTAQDYGLGPMVATEGIRFLVPSLCEGCGGRVVAFANEADRDELRAYYDEAGRVSAVLFSWTFVNGNILVQINGDLPEETAKKYANALNSLP